MPQDVCDTYKNAFNTYVIGCEECNNYNSLFPIALAAILLLLVKARQIQAVQAPRHINKVRFTYVVEFAYSDPDCMPEYSLTTSTKALSDLLRIPIPRNYLVDRTPADPYALALVPYQPRQLALLYAFHLPATHKVSVAQPEAASSDQDYVLVDRKQAVQKGRWGFFGW